MKIVKYIYISMLLLLCICLITSCGECSYAVEGYIYDSQTGLPVYGATVTLQARGHRDGGWTTDSTGSFYPYTGRGSCHQKTTLKVNKTGYKEVTIKNYDGSNIYLEKQ